MIYGYAGKYLEIDLSKEKISEISFDEDILAQYLGGRGLGAKILWDRLGKGWENINPLEPENLLLFLTGPLTGFFPGARICITGKSPQSNGIVGSTVGGEFGVELRCAGFDGIIVSGRAHSPVYVFVKDDHIEIKNAKHLWGKCGKETVKILTEEIREELAKNWSNFGTWKQPSILYIGPAGEVRSRMASIMAKWSHAAGYGGYGGVMGSKNLKAIVTKGTGPLPEVTNIKRIEKFIEEIAEASYANDAFRRWGTGSEGYIIGAERSSEPIRNWQEEWHNNKNFGVNRFETRTWIKKYWGDFGCPITCMKVAYVKTGPFKGAVSDNPDYELQAYLGTNLGIFEPNDVIYLTSLVNDLGFCGIQIGNVLGFTAELYQRSILNKKDLNGIDLVWGNTRAFVELINLITKKEGIGNILNKGVYRAALELERIKKVNLKDYVIHVKGIAIGAHGIRSEKDYVTDLSYATSVQGGDHTSIATLPLYNELFNVFMDSAVFCHFLATVHRFPIWEFLEAVTGWNKKNEWFDKMAKRIIHIQRAAILLGGPDVIWNTLTDDDNPSRFYKPLPSGPQTGKKIAKTKFEENKKKYYDAIGWDNNGIPKQEILIQLGLSEVNVELDKLRNK